LFVKVDPSPQLPSRVTATRKGQRRRPRIDDVLLGDCLFSTAVTRGAHAGTAFAVRLHDGSCATGKDNVRVQYGSFDTSTLTAKHGEVHISDR
jgi:hypothetical protein